MSRTTLPVVTIIKRSHQTVQNSSAPSHNAGKHRLYVFRVSNAQERPAKLLLQPQQAEDPGGFTFKLRDFLASAVQLSSVGVAITPEAVPLDWPLELDGESVKARTMERADTDRTMTRS